MKLHADRAEGVNVIHAYTRQSVSVNGQTYTRSILVPPTGDMIDWPATSVAELTQAHFQQIADAAPEVVIFGSGSTLRFPPPQVLQPLMAARIGIETMDTAAACRTYNILVAEGRRVMAALLVEP
ncbi:Mth938-like domain-containing protein [Aquabacterium sp.]|uniref:Mth938-like domain-containing protein n=1 Tax=Aquabacterium sp. TaxID=1872578 RepID=UPI002E3163A5|nr:Mth938-like domain-containing protein [Aquabacterium sp.]HEX5310673.1 Mth938-like domain-containing protein [Aquabacterium sp.]